MQYNPRIIYESALSKLRRLYNGLYKLVFTREELLLQGQDGTWVYIKNPGIAAEWFLINVIDPLMARAELVTPKNLHDPKYAVQMELP